MSEPSTRGSDLLERLLGGETRALGRALSLIEDETPAGRELLDGIFLRTGNAIRIGVTGAPGSGKSTLTNLLTKLLREREQRVAVLAVDPSSPFSGGAILGDRIRMQSGQGDAGVFIRSMASRGSLGGLAAATERACEVVDAAGFDWVIIETVGVGQSEMEVVSVADTTLVVLVPESGDAVQMMKAGLMEAGDLFVINKYDREGGSRLEKEINVLLSVQHERAPENAWMPQVIPTVATQGQGGLELLRAIEAHQTYQKSDPQRAEGVRRDKAAHRLRTLLRARVLEESWSRLRLEEQIEDTVGEVVERRSSPYAVVDRLVAQLWNGD